MRVGIIGGGESGVGAALLAVKVGDDPFVSDNGSVNPVYRQSLIENKVRFEEEGHNFDILVASDLIVKSPGIRDETPIIKRLKSRDKTIISELEYGAMHCCGQIIAVTGSNGKTTTTNLIHHILQLAKRNAVKGGNLGTSFCRLLLEEPCEIYVLEVSSFQLDDIVKFRPDIAVLINITPDHLDRYNYNFDLYADSKFKIALNQEASDTFIYGSEDDAILKRLSGVRSATVPVSQDNLIVREFSVNNPFLRGNHNQINASCAIHAVKKCGLNDEQISQGLRSFMNDDHRLQTVARINGIEWINDSKATNIDATYAALEAMTAPVVWIAGGVDKGNDYRKLKELVNSKVKMLICLGKDNKKLIAAFSDLSIKMEETLTMTGALMKAGQNAEEGDVVLLSPACASFDLFKNFEDRGNQFVSGVWELLRKRE